MRITITWLLALAMIGLTVPSWSHAQDWPEIIAKLKRAGAKARKEQLPTAYNNYAISLSRSGDFAQAAKTLEQALTLAPHSTQFKQNLAAIYLNHAFQVHQDRRGNGYAMRHKARHLAQKALQHNQGLTEAHVLLGDIAYDNQDLRLAKLSWSRAKKLEPGMQAIQDRMSKLEAEYSVEKNFERESNAYFDVRYQNGIQKSTAFDLRKYLEAARREVGKDFKYWPRHKLIVLVYSQEDFKKVRRGPDWVAGVYDGKIRVPLPHSQSSAKALRPTLYHEYTHALVHDLTGNRCPVWLNEGLAELQESKVRAPQLDLLRQAARVDRLISLESLDAAFQNRDPQIAGLAYQQSYSMVRYLAERFGQFRLRRALEALAQGNDLETTFSQEFRQTTSQFQKRWKGWLPELVR